MAKPITPIEQQAADNDSRRIIRWPRVKEKTSIPRTSWDRGVRAGVYPKGFLIGPPGTRAVGWYEADIDALIERLRSGE